MNYKKVLLFLLLLLPVLPGLPQETLSPALKEKIEALVTRDVPKDAPGVAFGMVQDGKVIYTRYAGYASLEDRIEIDSTARFNIASNGKQFTALAILRLISQDRLSLEDDIRKFFPDLYPGVTTPIQVRHLLTHTSGIRDIYDLLSLQNITWWRTTMNNQQVLDMISDQQTLNFQPGTNYLYSNSNYILLAEIIAHVTGQPFAVYMENMFDELGMTSTRFEPDFRAIAGPVAEPYFNFDTWTGYDWIWNVVGDGNLFTTLPDQLRFEAIIQGYDTPALSREVIDKSQQKIMDEFDYGYGLEFSAYRNLPVRFHHGGTGAWKATFLRFPDQHISFVTFSNSGKTLVVDQNQLIADVVLNLEPVDPDPDAVARTNNRPGDMGQETDADFTGFKPERLNGSYVNKELNLKLEIRFLAEKEYEVRIGESERKGSLIAPDQMQVDSYRLSFDGECGVALDGDRIKNVCFVRQPRP